METIITSITDLRSTVPGIVDDSQNLKMLDNMTTERRTTMQLECMSFWNNEKGYALFSIEGYPEYTSDDPEYMRDIWPVYCAAYLQCRHFYWQYRKCTGKPDEYAVYSDNFLFIGVIDDNAMRVKFVQFINRCKTYVHKTLTAMAMPLPAKMIVWRWTAPPAQKTRPIPRSGLLSTTLVPQDVFSFKNTTCYTITLEPGTKVLIIRTHDTELFTNESELLVVDAKRVNKREPDNAYTISPDGTEPVYLAPRSLQIQLKM